MSMLTHTFIRTNPISRYIKNFWGTILVSVEVMDMIVFGAKRTIGPHLITMITKIKWFLAMGWIIRTLYWIIIPTIKIVRSNHIYNCRNPLIRI